MAITTVTLNSFALMRSRDKEMAKAFNDPRRSNAFILLANIKGSKRKYLSRVGPPSANIRSNMRNGLDWYAVFEFRNGRWFCTIFNQCCD